MKYLKPLAILGAITLSACSSIDDKPQAYVTPEKPEECFFPDTDEQEAPLWVCTGEVDGLITGLGYYPAANKAYNLARQITQQRARVDLARKVKLAVIAELEDRTAATGSGVNSTVDEYQSDIATSISKMVLKGTKTYNSVMDENGGLHLIVFVDQKLANSKIAKQLDSSYNNNEAAFIKRESKEALTDLRERGKQ